MNKKRMNNKQSITNVQRPITRREAVLGYGRMAVAGVLTAMGSYLLVRKRNPAKGRQVCISRVGCVGCRAFDGCGLPQALSARRLSEKNLNH